MGCFSFICKKSNKPVNSTSFEGDPVHLFLLKDGKVIERMSGNYDSYGGVFDIKGDSFEWAMDWDAVCNLMFDDNKSNGIAAILGPYWKEGDPHPITRSLGDPNQGWGSNGPFQPFKEPVHVVY